MLQVDVSNSFSTSFRLDVCFLLFTRATKICPLPPPRTLQQPPYFLQSKTILSEGCSKTMVVQCSVIFVFRKLIFKQVFFGPFRTLKTILWFVSVAESGLKVTVTCRRSPVASWPVGHSRIKKPVWKQTLYYIEPISWFRACKNSLIMDANGWQSLIIPIVTLVACSRTVLLLQSKQKKVQIRTVSDFHQYFCGVYTAVFINYWKIKRRSKYISLEYWVLLLLLAYVWNILTPFICPCSSETTE